MQTDNPERYKRLGYSVHDHRDELRSLSFAIGTSADLARRLYVDHDTTGTYPADTGPVHIEALLSVVGFAADALHRRIVRILGEDDEDLASMEAADNG
jgi:hypothetical protein